MLWVKLLTSFRGLYPMAEPAFCSNGQPNGTDWPGTMKMMNKCIFVLSVYLMVSSAYGGQRVSFTTEDLVDWNYPRGLIEIAEDGTRVKRFGSSFNAVTNREEFSPRSIGPHGINRLETPSNPADVELVADQDYTTWWMPNQSDPVGRRWVQVDLGRIVAAKRIRLVFPDTQDAHPFPFFSVYTSPGIPLHTSPQQLRFTRVGRPVNDNTSPVVEFDLVTHNESPATGQHLVTEDPLDFALIRFVRFEPTSLTTNAGLAQIEVEAVGFNLSTRVNTDLRLEEGHEVWGGRAWTSDHRTCQDCGTATSPEGLIDVDLAARYWAIEAGDTSPDWRTWGNWWGVDLGSVFRIDRIIWLPIVVGESPILYGFDRERHVRWRWFDFLVSDGTPSSTADPEVEGPYQYDLLSAVNNSQDPRRHTFDFQFPPKTVRYIFWRRLLQDGGSWGRALQVFVYHSEGYPAQVSLESEDIDLGSALSIRQIEWEGDIPEGTRVAVETQTGNGFQTILRYFLANGQEVTQQAWEEARSRHRGPIVEDVVRDASWSEWSAPHRYTGQDFLSPTPRRWIRIRATLISDDPQLMPSLHAIHLRANSPVISHGITGHITPREAMLDSLQEFTYTIKPGSPNPADLGFDQVMVNIPPEAAEAELVGVRVGGEMVEATSTFSDNVLQVQLPPPTVKQDSVEVSFTTRLYRSPTVFEAFVANSSEQDNEQAVSTVDFGDQVFVPAITEATSFFHNLRYSKVFSPNEDGINDLFELTFSIVKTDRQPEVKIFTLHGALVTELPRVTQGAGRLQYFWDGREASGQTVKPGIYILQLNISTDSGDETIQKLVHVVY